MIDLFIKLKEFFLGFENDMNWLSNCCTRRLRNIERKLFNIQHNQLDQHKMGVGLTIEINHKKYKYKMQQCN